MRTSPHRRRLGICRCLLFAVLFGFGAETTNHCAWAQAPPATSKPHSKASAKKPATPAPEPESAEQPVQQTPPPPPPAPPTDPLGRTTPYGSVLGFLRAAESKDYERAAQFLDGKHSPQDAETLAIQLKYLLDQGLSTGIEKLSHEPAGDIEDKLRYTRELVGTVTLPEGDLKIYLDLIRRPKEASIWLFSQETLALVPEAYDRIHKTDYAKIFPAWASRIVVFSVPLWRWAMIFLSLLVIFVLASLLNRVVLWLLRKVLSSRLSGDVESSVLALKAPIFSLTLAILWATAGGYAITALSRHYWRSLAIFLVWLSSGWLLIAINNIVAGFVRQRYLLRGRVERATFIGLIGRLSNILVALVVIIGLLTRAGINVSALLTGLGIGGVAIALAAQKSLADLFGGLSIIMRGAVRVGDFCQIDKILGTVEDIGISSLSLRTLDRSLVSIPNSKVAEVNLENFSFRDQFWVHQVLTLRFDTSHKVLKTVLDNVYQILKDYTEIDKSSARTRLINLTPTGPQIEIFAYMRRPGLDYPTFLAAQQPLLLKILSAIEDAGASIAAPVPVLKMDALKADDPSNTR